MRVLRAPVLARVGRGVVSPQLVALAPPDAGPGQGRARCSCRCSRRARSPPGCAPRSCRTYHCDVTLPPGPGQRRAADRRRRVEPPRHAPLRRRGRHQRGLRAAQPHVAVDRAVDGASSRRRARAPPPGRPDLPRDRRPARRLPRPDRPREGPGAPGPRVPRAARPGRPAAASAATHRTSQAAASSTQVRAAMGDDPRIRLLGFVPEERIGDFYASLDVFTLPSVNAFEAFGIVQAVAMLAGVPVLSSDIPGVRQPVVQTGFGTLVPPADEPAITRALQDLYTEPAGPHGAARPGRSARSRWPTCSTPTRCCSTRPPRRARYGEHGPVRAPTTTGTNGQAGDRPALRWYARLVRRYCGPGPYLDFGCGTGHLLRRLAAHGRAAGFEISRVLGGGRPRHRARGAVSTTDPDDLARRRLRRPDRHARARAPRRRRRGGDARAPGGGCCVPGGRALVVTPDPAGRGHALLGRTVGRATPTRRTSTSSRTPSGGSSWPTTGSACCARAATGCGTCPTAVGRSPRRRVRAVPSLAQYLAGRLFLRAGVGRVVGVRG